ncbi:hypothetical protein [Peptostreptococcus faecalis]|uniref:hypothetical protein n=1 Tax=Peptostreptococcus faecalis TaxID=2045015 RepID=UPI000C7A2012|nr:hypothetical protein [Peptostreptococcus faecalis]
MNIVYPVVIEKNKEDNVFYVTLPTFEDREMVTYASTYGKAVVYAEEVISLLLYDIPIEEYPSTTLDKDFKLKENESLVYVDMDLDYHFSQVIDLENKVNALKEAERISEERGKMVEVEYEKMTKEEIRELF